MKVGVLYSRSKVHPELMPDFIDGLKASLKFNKLNNGVELLMESIGFGGNEKEVYEKTEKLLVLDNVDILVAYIDLRVLNLIEPLIYSKGKLLVVVNGGANYPENRVPQSNIVFLTLRHSFLCWLTGDLAGNRDDAQAAVAASFYDAGYLHIAGITRSYMKQGGTIRFNYVNKDKYDDSFEITPLSEFLLKEKDIKQVLSVFDSPPASYFYERLNQLQNADVLELFVSPMMLEDEALKGKTFRYSIDGFQPYDPNDPYDSNKIFQSFYKSETKRTASVFAMQGWEAGAVIHELNLADTDQAPDGTELRDKLIGKNIESPRGELKLDEETNYFTSPVYYATIRNNPEKRVIKKKDATAEWKEFLSSPVEGISSGWTNTYLCY